MMPIKKEVTIGDCRLILGDCLEILPTLKGVDSIVSDPPYGMKWNGKVSMGKNGTGGTAKSKFNGVTIKNDDVPFDATPFLNYENVILFGFNHFPACLHKGTVLVWLKRYDEGFGSFLSDAEVAWMNKGHGVYCFRDVSMQGDSKNKKHPTQKPIPLMTWCIEKLPKETVTICDPFMGSGTTLVACAKMGRKGIGIELDPDYFEIACKRVQEAYDSPDMFVAAPKAKPEQDTLI